MSECVRHSTRKNNNFRKVAELSSIFSDQFGRCDWKVPLVQLVRFISSCISQLSLSLLCPALANPAFSVHGEPVSRVMSRRENVDIPPSLMTSWRLQVNDRAWPDFWLIMWCSDAPFYSYSELLVAGCIINLKYLSSESQIYYPQQYLKQYLDTSKPLCLKNIHLVAWEDWECWLTHYECSI